MKRTCWHFLALLLLWGATLPLGAQNSVFTYEGRLCDGGQAANGYYDFQFRLADAVANGNYLGPTLTNVFVPVRAGLFTVGLDFGASVFDGSPRWLEIAVCTNAGTSLSVLAPREQLTATPYALCASNALSLSGTLPASQVSGVLAPAQLPAPVLTNGACEAHLSGTFTAKSITGNGAGLTNLNGLNLQPGTVSSNALDAGMLALLDQLNQAVGDLNFVNVKTYGAKGDGVADDTAAIQAAMNALLRGFGGGLTRQPVLFFPAGTYLLSQTIYCLGSDVAQDDVYAKSAGVRIRGAGQSYTVLQWPRTFTGMGFAFTNNPIHGITLQDMEILGPVATYPAVAGAEKSVGVQLGGQARPDGFDTIGRQLQVKDCLVYGWGKGLVSINNWGMEIGGCSFASNLVEAVSFCGSHSVRVHDCQFTSGFAGAWVAGTGIGFHSPPPPNLGGGDNAVVTTCTIDNFTNCIYNDDLMLTTIGNNLEWSGSYFTIVGLGKLNSLGDYILDGPLPQTAGFAALTLFDADAAHGSTISSPSWTTAAGRPSFNVINSASATYFPTFLGRTVSGLLNTNTGFRGGVGSHNAIFAGPVTASSITNNGVVWIVGSGAPTGLWPIGSRYSRADTGDEYLFKRDHVWHIVFAP